jgi:hypothetical protein
MDDEEQYHPSKINYSMSHENRSATNERIGPSTREMRLKEREEKS